MPTRRTAGAMSIVTYELLWWRVLTSCLCDAFSTLLKMDTLILITYGTSYLSAFDRGQDAWERLDAHNAQRNDGRSGVMERAEKIRRRWRTQRFPTFSLPMLGLGKEDYLLPDVQAKMVLGHTKKRESAMATVPIDDDKLREQVAQYSHELHLRVEARYHRAEEEQQHHEREQRNIEARKKKLVREFGFIHPVVQS